MKSRYFALIASLNCLLLTSAFYLVVNAPQLVARQISHSLSNEEILEKAKSITVKVKVGKTAGSGILIERTGPIYQLVTNRHVINRGESYQILTPDGNLYGAELIAVGEEDDLAILQFSSIKDYRVASLKTSSLQIGEQLFAVGFPFNSDKSILTTGELFLQLDIPLKNGYQLGYTGEIQQGMSGGVILNTRGEVIGVNGRSAYPILEDYQFQDGSFPEPKLQEKMRALNWGVPIEKVVALHNSELNREKI